MNVNFRPKSVLVPKLVARNPYTGFPIIEEIEKQKLAVHLLLIRVSHSPMYIIDGVYLNKESANERLLHFRSLPNEKLHDRDIFWCEVPLDEILRKGYYLHPDDTREIVKAFD